jgi:hypothetical protein
MFFLTYLPQVAVLAFISGPLGQLFNHWRESKLTLQPSSLLFPLYLVKLISSLCSSLEDSSSAPLVLISSMLYVSLAFNFHKE